MINRRKMLRNVLMGAATAAALRPFRGWAAGECDALGRCVVGIRTEVFNLVAAKQRSSQWCWAACVQMILNYYGIPVSQEEIVYRIKGAFVDEAANAEEIVAALNGPATTRRGETVYLQCQTMGIATENIIRDLYEDRPLLLAYQTGEGGHAVVLTAISFRTYQTYYGEDYELETVTVRDPWPDRPSRQVWNVAELAMRTSFLARVWVSR